MRILVTGAAGFIGSHLLEKLLQNRHDVVGLDNFDSFYDPQIKRDNLKVSQEYSSFQLVKGDILNAGDLSTVFGRKQIEVVVHLATRAGVRPSIEDPLGYFRNNIEGTAHLLEFCRRNGVKKFILASSSSVYGNNPKVPFSEEDNVDSPISPYAASKKASELISYNYHHLYGISVFALRFFTAYGPRQRPDMAIHKFSKLISEGEPVPVFGEGRLKRDFTFIDDIIQGVVNSIEAVQGFEIINLGESRTTTVSEVIQIIEKYVGKRAITRMLPLQPGDVIETNADIGKARRLLNYVPTVDIESGIPRYLEWYFAGRESRVSS